MDKYEEALERAKEWEREHPNGYVIRDMMEFIFPGYNESEDEQARQFLLAVADNNIDVLRSLKTETYIGSKGLRMVADDIKGWENARAWLEKQKEQPKEELIYRMNGLMQKYIDEGKDEAEREHRMKCYNLFWDALEDADFFKQKPVEWSEEDETCLEYALWCVTKTRHFVAKDACDLDACRCAERWLKSLRPQPHWKPSEEQIKVFFKANPVNLMPEELAIYHSLCNDLKKL